MKVSMWLEDAIAAGAFIALVASTPLVLSLEREAPKFDATADEIVYWKRHERQSRDCRGQQYVAHCCEDARTDLTCIDGEIKWTSIK